MNRTAIAVDRDRCIGAGMCVWTAPDVFDQDDEDGRVLLLRATPGSDQEALVREAVSACPSGAISFA
ncbi:ferredoxin [Nocardia inohanensis]|uniref:ferredoxin n=1 Tax=Nocardia inohanensis TaxID=209246 RepID=UPI00082DC6AF|nr:ferredoxin [Nocardia inohanensis]